MSASVALSDSVARRPAMSVSVGGIAASGRCTPSSPSVVSERVGFGQAFEQQGEDRAGIAAGALAHKSKQTGRRSGAGVRTCCHSEGPDLVEPGDTQALVDDLVGEAHEEPSGVSGSAVGAGRHEQHDRQLLVDGLVRERRCEMGDELDRRRVGPLRVFEHDQHGLVGRGREQRSTRLHHRRSRSPCSSDAALERVASLSTPRESSTFVTGRSGRSEPSMHRPTRGRTPAAPASSSSCVARRDFPTPASPRSTPIRGCRRACRPSSPAACRARRCARRSARRSAPSARGASGGSVGQSVQRQPRCGRPVPRRGLWSGRASSGRCSTISRSSWRSAVDGCTPSSVPR